MNEQVAQEIPLHEPQPVNNSVPVIPKAKSNLSKIILIAVVWLVISVIGVLTLSLTSSGWGGAIILATAPFSVPFIVVLGTIVSYLFLKGLNIFIKEERPNKINWIYLIIPVILLILSALFVIFILFAPANRLS